MNYINNNVVNTLTPTELDNLKGTTSNIQTQLNQISPNVGTINPVNQVIASNDTLNTFANKTQGQINNILANGTGGGGVNSVTLDGIQTLTNKTLTDCIANTQLSTDVSTKIATTQFIEDKLQTTNTYIGTTVMAETSITLSTSWVDLISITIPINGTYEININASLSTRNIIYLRLKNGTNIIADSLFTPISAQNISSASISGTFTRNIILINLTANSVITLQGSATSNTDSFVKSDNTGNGKTTLSYNRLGLTSNVVSNTTYNEIVYYTGNEIKLETELSVCSFIVPVSGTYEIDYNLWFWNNNHIAGGGYLKNNSTIINNSYISEHFFMDSNNRSMTINIYKSIIVQNLTANSVITLMGTKSPGTNKDTLFTSASNSLFNPTILGSTYSGGKSYLKYKLLGLQPLDMSLYVLKSDLTYLNYLNINKKWYNNINPALFSGNLITFNNLSIEINNSSPANSPYVKTTSSTTIQLSISGIHVYPTNGGGYTANNRDKVSINSINNGSGTNINNTRFTDYGLDADSRVVQGHIYNYTSNELYRVYIVRITPTLWVSSVEQLNF